MVPVVVLHGDREKRGDRPALHDVKALVVQAPLNVLRLAEVGLDPPTEPRQFDDLCVGQHRLLLPVRRDRYFLCPPSRRRDDGHLLGGDRLGYDVAVAHRGDVRARHAGDERLTEAKAGLHGAELPVGRDRVGREQDAGRLSQDHLLHDHGHAFLSVVEAVVQPVGQGALGEQRGPAPSDPCEDGSRAHDVQVRVQLAGVGCRGQIFRDRAGPDGAGGALAEPGECTGDRRRQLAGHVDCFEHPTDVGTHCPDCLPVGRVQEREAIETFVDQRCLGQDPPEGLRGHAEPGRHAYAVDPRELSETRPLSAHDCDLRLVDLPQIHHVKAHLSTFLPPSSSDCHGSPDFVTADRRHEGPLRSCGLHCQQTDGPCGKPPTSLYDVLGGGGTGVQAGCSRDCSDVVGGAQ